MTTPVERAAAILKQSLLNQLARPIPEAARLAYCHDGPSVAELEVKLRELHERYGR